MIFKIYIFKYSMNILKILQALLFLIGGCLFLAGAIAVLLNANIKVYGWIYLTCALFYIFASLLDLYTSIFTKK
jgi:hypothetical protein